MSDRYPWAAEVLALLGAPPESVAVISGVWCAGPGGRAVYVRPLGAGRARVHIESAGLRLLAHEVTDVPATVRALLVGLRATQAALGGVTP